MNNGTITLKIAKFDHFKTSYFSSKIHKFNVHSKFFQVSLKLELRDNILLYDLTPKADITPNNLKKLFHDSAFLLPGRFATLQVGLRQNQQLNR